MPWHTKLGFTEGPCISTLHSLTCDGGVVTALDFVITKVWFFDILNHLCSDRYASYTQLRSLSLLKAKTEAKTALGLETRLKKWKSTNSGMYVFALASRPHESWLNNITEPM